MVKINFVGIDVELTQNKENVQVTYLSQKATFGSQQLDNTAKLLLENWKIIFEIFAENVRKNKCIFEENVLGQLSLILAVYFMHSSITWNMHYRNKKPLIVDGQNIAGSDGFRLVVRFLKNQPFPDWQRLTVCLLSIEQEEFDTRLKQLDNFNSK